MRRNPRPAPHPAALLFPALCAAGTMLGAHAQPTVIDGELGGDDRKLVAGEYVDIYTHQVTGPVRLTIEMSSDTIDTYLWVVGPTQDSIHNDDAVEDDATRSAVTIEYPPLGDWTIYATTFGPDDAGPYRFTITEEPMPALSLLTNSAGQLDPEDSQLETKEYYETRTVALQAGQTLLVDMISTGFDPYLIVIGPDDARGENDDFATRADLSRVVMTAPSTGEYTIIATSFAPEATGPFELFVRTSEAAAADSIEDAPAPPAGRPPKP